MPQKAPYGWMMLSSARESLYAQKLWLEGMPGLRKLPQQLYRSKNSCKRECWHVERAAFRQLVERLKAQHVENTLWIP